MIKHIPFDSSDPHQPSDRIPLVAENPAAIVSEVLAVFAAYESATFDMIRGHVTSSIAGDRDVDDFEIEAAVSYLEAINCIKRLDRDHGSTPYRLIRPIALSEGVTNFLES
jgi:hypothetical protein